MSGQCLSRIQQFLLHYKPRLPFIPHEYIQITIVTSREDAYNNQQNKEESTEKNCIFDTFSIYTKFIQMIFSSWDI